MTWILFASLLACDNTTTTDSNPSTSADTSTTTSTASGKGNSAVTGTACSDTAADAPGSLTGIKTSATKLGTTTTSFKGVVDAVHFDVEIGAVDVLLGKSKQAVVTEEIKDVRANPADPPLDNPQTSVTLAKGVLTIKSECPTQPCNSSTYTVELPAAADEVIGLTAVGAIGVFEAASDTVNVQTAAGSLEVTGSPDGAKLVTDAGQVTADLDGGLVVDARSMAGAVTITGPISTEVCAQTDAGDVSVTNGTADVVGASTDAGDVSVALTATPTSIDADTAIGSIDIEVPKGTYAVTADAGVLGTVTLTGVTNDPKSTHTIEAETALGSITVSGQ